MTELKQKFISESIKPVVDVIDMNAMASGGPGLPAEFVWRGNALRIGDVLRTWRETGPCTHGGGERYVRKHWYEVKIEDGRTAKLYFERKARGANLLKRWWLFSITD